MRFFWYFALIFMVLGAVLFVSSKVKKTRYECEYVVVDYIGACNGNTCAVMTRLGKQYAHLPVAGEQVKVCSGREDK